MPLRIYNTMTREKIAFVPLKPDVVGMYLCGITPYAPSHIGHARGLVAFDVVYRWLRRKYGNVVYVRNFTDIDDKIIHRANTEGIEAVAVAGRYIAMYHESAGKLGCLAPTHEPRVSETIPEIIDLIASIVARGIAYAVDGDVYFEVAKFPAYGRLSGRTLEALSELEAGARVEVDERKRSPFDFALWKAAKPGEPWWDSPWGKGRPGWHIECSAMSSKYLGTPFDLHGGGKDLVFPHHENEIAQSCAGSGQDVCANIWMHNGFVNLMPEGCPRCNAALPVSPGGQGDEAEEATARQCASCGYVLAEEDLKMSKSRGNFYPLNELLDEYEPEAVRALLLSSHYRTPISFSHSLVVDQQKRLGRVYETLAMVDEFLGQSEPEAGPRFAELFGYDPVAKLDEAIEDDFNTAKALGDAGELFKIANDLVRQRDKERIGRKLKAGPKAALLREIRQAIGAYTEVLGLWGDDPSAFLLRRRTRLLAGKPVSEADVLAKLEERTLARQRKDFAESDRIRDALKEHGIVVKDTPAGTTWDVEDD